MGGGDSGGMRVVAGGGGCACIKIPQKALIHLNSNYSRQHKQTSSKSITYSDMYSVIDYA